MHKLWNYFEIVNDVDIGPHDSSILPVKMTEASVHASDKHVRACVRVVSMRITRSGRDQKTRG